MRVRPNAEELRRHVVALASYRKGSKGIECICGFVVQTQTYDDLLKAFQVHRSEMRGMVPSRTTGNPNFQRKQNRTFSGKAKGKG